MLRVLILIALASLLWCPSASGWACGRAPRRSYSRWHSSWRAFPANLLFPLAVFGIVTWKLNPDLWLSPLMILGTQWYICQRAFQMRG